MKEINSIYIIDDDRIFVYGIRKMLKSLVVCEDINAFANGNLALSNIRKLNDINSPLPEVIFLDLNMPLMDGWQFLEALFSLSLEQRIHINIITSSIDRVDLKNFELFKNRSTHVLRYHKKPLNLEKVKDMTKSV